MSVSESPRVRLRISSSRITESRRRYACERLVDRRDVPEPKAKGALHAGVDVAEDADPIGAGGIEVVRVHLLELEVRADALRQPLLCAGVEVAKQAMRAEDGQAGVLERDPAHERVAVRALAAHLVGIGASGLVAV